MAVDLETASKEYFSNLSTLTKKISVDIRSTQEAYQEFWHSLSREDQNQVIDESVICPSAVIKYAHLPTAVIKDNPNVHSWFTKSQLDLFNQNPINRERASAPSGNSESMRKMEQSKKVIRNQMETNREKDNSIEKTNTSKIQKSSVLKPRIPPPPPPSKNRVLNAEMESSDDSSAVSSATDIPKTGFDFLDNW